MKPEDLKLVVQEKYGEIASQSSGSCCGNSGCCGNVDYTAFSDDYSKLAGYNPDADLGLGCGLPTEFAGLKPGDHLLDLGSGAGNDCFVARTIVGKEGFVTGIDFTDAMLDKANRNLSKSGYTNIEFIKGDIENMPFKSNSYDVVISNCVINLVPDKNKAFGEIFRVLKPGGHFCISDIVLTGVLPAKLQEAAEMYAGCVSGAIIKNQYIELIEKNGFTDIQINKEKEIEIPDQILLNYITSEELKALKHNKVGIFSITVNASKKIII